jgi:enediyne biosynthesis protein E4
VLMNRPSPDGSGRTFVDATIESNVGAIPGGGSTTELRAMHLAAAADVDNDGDLDLFSGTNVDPTADPKKNPDPGDRSQILLNDGKGVFSLAPPSAATPGADTKWPTTGATFADVDRDGKIDLFVGFWYKSYGASAIGVQAQLYRGNGDGSFESATAAAKLTTLGSNTSLAKGTNHRPAYGVTSCDLDGDGAPELMVSAYGRQWNLLYQNDGKGAFTEIGQASGFAGDTNQDYSDNQFFACYCTVDPDKKPDCAGVAPPLTSCPDPATAYWGASSDPLPWRNNGNTFSTLCADINGDGKNDLYSAEIAHWHIGQSSDKSQILINTTAGPGAPITFARIDNEESGTIVPHPTTDWNEGAIFAGGADLDNDGRLDLFLGATDYPDQYGYVYHQGADGRFAEVGEDWGLHSACASGLAIADFDRDGDLDVVVGAGTARDCAKVWDANYVLFFENSASQFGSHVAIRLRGDGVTANRAGIGARITVKTGDLSQTRDIGGGYGHMAMQQDTVAFFGLGACETIDEVTVRWPTDPPQEQTYTGVPVGKLVELAQGSPDVTVVTPGG